METDLNLICENISIFYMGSQHCEPGHNYSTGFCDRYLIHYIVSGKGKFKCDGITYNLKAGNAFLIAGEKADITRRIMMIHGITYGLIFQAIWQIIF